MIFTKPSDLYNQVIRDVHKTAPEWMYILTYGLWAGISPSGWITGKCNSFKFFKSLNESKINVKILVGYETILPKVCFSTAKYFTSLEFIAVPKMHSKTILMSNGLCAIGSANINDSYWGELIRYEKLSKNDFVEVLMHINRQERNGTPVMDVENPDISELLKGLV